MTGLGSCAHLPPLLPRAGCLPSLATIPIFIGLFRSLSDFSSREEAGSAGARWHGAPGLWAAGDSLACAAPWHRVPWVAVSSF